MDETVGLAQSLAEASGVQSLGALPIIVLSRGRDQDQGWQRKQSELLQLSSNSSQEWADESGHNIQVDQPAAAVRAIEQMVEQTRRQAKT